MGVPKFFRWLSERYPCINENVNECNIPEFDNFYVDMNGVYHICSHPSDDVKFRLSEAQIFDNIGLYVEFLFNLIQPRRVFFLSVDGVAPRSKMNQQRSRRYKTAKEAIENEEKARRLGESLPTAPRFDSNCITPGTEFMHRLHRYMVAFLAAKVQSNQSWREVQVIYSGYDVPGEGEHKIMDYIRHCKTADAFEPTVRHCLYGLDADLINLGLSCHEPYFSLLREEVVFSKSARRHCDPFKTNFQLLHLSILRGYLDKEFDVLRRTLTAFEYSLERVIDDWILINFLIGNDFLPHIPKFHVDKGSIQWLYDIYKSVLPTLDGYLNTGGTIHLDRFRAFLRKLGARDVQIFDGSIKNMKYFKQDAGNVSFEAENVADPNQSTDVNEAELTDLTDEEDVSDAEDESEHHSELSDVEEEAVAAAVEEAEKVKVKEEKEAVIATTDKFTLHKNKYYRAKLHFTDLNTDVRRIVNEYVRGLQWVLFYYYNGCVSWNWFYPYYYAPYVSDLAAFDIARFDFEASEPFQPLMQLLAVIPQASKTLLPKVFQPLTCAPDSPLRQFFPTDVRTDLNEKVHDYEAIILIPFIDEKALVGVFKQYEDQLTTEEQTRNKFGVHYSLTHSDEAQVNADTDGQTVFQKFTHVSVKQYSRFHFVLPPETIYKGLNPGVNLKEIIGFPTLSGISFGVNVKRANLKVFRSATTNPSLLLTVRNRNFSEDELKQLTEQYIDRIVYINWPLLAEAKLIELMDPDHKYVLNWRKKATAEPLSKFERGFAKQSANSHCWALRNQRGIELDHVAAMAKVRPLQSQQYIVSGGKLVLHKQWSDREVCVPLEFVLFVEQPVSRTPVHRSLAAVFTSGRSLVLTEPSFYGSQAEVVEYLKGRNLVKVNVPVGGEPDFRTIQYDHDRILESNFVFESKLLGDVKYKLKLPDFSFRRLLGSVLICYKGDKNKSRRVNIGLKLKYKSNAELKIKPLCVPGYSMMYGDEVVYSRKVAAVLGEYYGKFSAVFDMIGAPGKSKPFFELNDLFPTEELDRKEKSKKLAEIREWVESLDLSKSGHIKSDADCLDNCIVKAIEDAVQLKVKTSTNSAAPKRIMQHLLPPQAFYVPEFILRGDSLPDPKVKFYSFDRVVNIRKCIAVPFGAKGTVIGVYRHDDEVSANKEHSLDKLDNDLFPSHSGDQGNDSVVASVEVLFDQPFDGGLKTRSTKLNTFKMKPGWLLNFTYGQVQAKKNNKIKNMQSKMSNLKIQNEHKIPTMQNKPNTSSFQSNGQGGSNNSEKKKPTLQTNNVPSVRSVNNSNTVTVPKSQTDKTSSKQPNKPTTSSFLNPTAPVFVPRVILKQPQQQQQSSNPTQAKPQKISNISIVPALVSHTNQGFQKQSEQSKRSTQLSIASKVFVPSNSAHHKHHRTNNKNSPLERAVVQVPKTHPENDSLNWLKDSKQKPVLIDNSKNSGDSQSKPGKKNQTAQNGKQIHS